MLVPLLSSVWLQIGVLSISRQTDDFVNTGANALLVWTHRDKRSMYMNALRFFFGLGAFLRRGSCTYCIFRQTLSS